MTWVIAVIIAIVSNVCFTILAKYRMQKTTYNNGYIVVWGYTAAAILIASLPFGSLQFHLSLPLILLSILSFFLFAVATFSQFGALREEQASVVAQIFPMNNLFTVILSILIFKSHGSVQLLFGCLLILTGAIAAQPFVKGFKPSKGTLYAVAFAASLGSAFAIEAFIVKNFSPGLFALLAFLVPAIINQFIFLRPKVSEMKYEWQQQKGYIIINALALASASFFLNLAFSLGNSAQVAAIYAFATIIITIVGIVFFKEHTHVPRKILAAIIATLGVILVSI